VTGSNRSCASGRRFRWALIGLALAVAAGASLAEQASTRASAFPGENGRIVFSQSLGSGADLYSALPDGSGLRRLTTSPEDDLDPAVSPDGKEIAFVSYRNRTTAGPISG
jgi:Tol biopolymer transport system component